MEQRRARGMLAAAAVIFGTLAPFVRGISVSSGELALYRAVMAALLVGGYLLVSGQQLALHANRREAALLLLSGMAMGVNWILLFEAYRYTTVSVATLSYYFAPVLVTAACPLLFHERLTGKQIVCFVMSTLGLVLVIGGASNEEAEAAAPSTLSVDDMAVLSIDRALEDGLRIKDAIAQVVQEHPLADGSLANRKQVYAAVLKIKG